MRAVVQRVRAGWISVSGEEVGRIETGLVVLVGVERGDSEEAARRLAAKVSRLRIFPAGEHGMDQDVTETGGAVLSVSQFTLMADTSRGRRPSFAAAAPATEARPLWEAFNRAVEAAGIPLARGTFQADMDVHLVNWGPVTVILEAPPSRVDGAREQLREGSGG